MAVEPPPTSFAFPPPSDADEHGRVVVGGDLEPGTLLAAYRGGLFPMRQETGELTWWSPDPRGILAVADLRISRSLRKAVPRFRITVDACFDDVVAACAERDAGEYHWITEEIRTAYGRLHELGWAHSVEAWTVPDGDEPPELAGGLYGVAIGGMFGGESMFHRRPDASKVALVALVGLLVGDDGGAPAAADRVIDLQWLTPHLESLGATQIPRTDYLERLRRALAMPPPPAFTGREAPPGP